MQLESGIWDENCLWCKPVDQDDEAAQDEGRIYLKMIWKLISAFFVAIWFALTTVSNFVATFSCLDDGQRILQGSFNVHCMKFQGQPFVFFRSKNLCETGLKCDCQNPSSTRQLSESSLTEWRATWPVQDMNKPYMDTLGARISSSPTWKP